MYQLGLTKANRKARELHLYLCICQTLLFRAAYTVHSSYQSMHSLPIEPVKKVVIEEALWRRKIMPPKDLFILSFFLSSGTFTLFFLLPSYFIRYRWSLKGAIFRASSLDVSSLLSLCFHPFLADPSHKCPFLLSRTVSLSFPVSFSIFLGLYSTL